MNVIWIVADTFRQDHLGAYGNRDIHTPTLDALAAQSARFDRHYAAGFPTMPARADHATGRWTHSFMQWEKLPDDEPTISKLLAEKGWHTAACVDTPFYIRGGMNYDMGFQTFFFHPGQEGSPTRVQKKGNHESRDVKEALRYESDLNAPHTISTAMRWLERHYKEDFFLYVDTWDPHEPWDAPEYYTERYWPGFDGEVIQPVYSRWQDNPGFTRELVDKAHATYCGEITMVDAWIGHLLRRVEDMGLMDDTVIVFTSDHGFYFGEHGGMFGKMTFDRRTDGTLYRFGDDGAYWAHSPLYEELTRIPLLIQVPGLQPVVYSRVTSVVDVMPTVLEALGVDRPETVEGRSLLPRMRDAALPGRESVVTTIPFANTGDWVRSVDNEMRALRASQVTTVTTDEWTLLYSMDEGMSELYNVKSDPRQESNVISRHPALARELHASLLRFMTETAVPAYLLEARREILI